VTAALRAALAQTSRLLRYPDAEYGARLRAAIDATRAAVPAAGEALEAFARGIEGRPGPEIEELFTRTFDLNPLAALEVGWHLYGEDYARGAFLVRMRQALRGAGIDEGGELPDHLASLLLLLAHLPAEEAAALAATAIVPAIERMLPPLETAASAFAPLLKAVWGLAAACATPAPQPPVDEVAHA
jgi:nitrate reductase delta subunit